MRILFLAFLLVLFAGFSWFQYGQNQSFYELSQRVVDVFDGRPAREIVIFGNSRTYYNHMPRILRNVADSAGSDEKYVLTVQARPGASLETLWGDPYTQALLTRTWDDAIVQSASRAQYGEDFHQSFLTFGERLLGAIKLNSSKASLVVNWAYDPDFFENAPAGSGREIFVRFIANDSAYLAEKADARTVNVSRAWEFVRNTYPEIKLTLDGNHPSLAGSFLFALVLFNDLSGGNADKVTYVPDGLRLEDAENIRSAIMRFH